MKEDNRKPISIIERWKEESRRGTAVRIRRTSKKEREEIRRKREQKHNEQLP